MYDVQNVKRRHIYATRARGLCLFQQEGALHVCDETHLDFDCYTSLVTDKMRYTKFVDNTKARFA